MSKRIPLRCRLGFHRRARRKPCHKSHDPLKYCEFCRQPMEKTADGDWRVTRA